MSDNLSPDAGIQITRQSTEFLYYPTRRAIRIEDGDWERWMRSISTLKERDTIYRDIGFACLGIAIPSLISSMATQPSVTQLPAWISILYLVIGSITIVVGPICLIFSHRLHRNIVQDIAGILQDMQEVRERSVRLEEKIEHDNPI